MILRVNIHGIIKVFFYSNGIKRLNTRMSYNRLPKLGELIQLDLVSKPQKG